MYTLLFSLLKSLHYVTYSSNLLEKVTHLTLSLYIFTVHLLKDWTYHLFVFYLTPLAILIMLKCVGMLSFIPNH